MAILLVGVLPQATTDHLYKQVSRSGGPGDQDTINVRYICTFRKDAAVQEYRKLSCFESGEPLHPLFAGRVTSDEASIDAIMPEHGCQT